ncbi:MAG: aminoacyl-tRNA deacylase [Anaerolineae bacterium]|nr:aminoacyl-tRNA deacylase [Anaerolineae bacterium]
MSDSVQKLNSMRFLEAQGVTYEIVTYDEAIRDGVGVAEAVGLPAEQVYKTLMVQIKDGEFALVMIASDRTLDLKRFARSIGQKKATMTTKRGAEAATGLKTGGIGALALTHKRWGVYLDEAAQQQEAILVNAGQRGINLKIAVAELIRVLNAKIVAVTDPPADAASTETGPDASADQDTA